MRQRAAGFLALLAASAAVQGCKRDEKPKDELVAETLVELNLVDPLPEQGSSFLGAKKPGHAEAVARVRSLLDAPLTKGLFVRLGAQQGRLGDVDDWAAVLDAYRAKKLPVHCHSDGLDNAGYALAAHCDRLSVSPASMVELVGLAAQVVHGRALLEMLGVEADLLQMGKYKGASEPFTRDTISDELRTSLSELLTDLDTELKAHLGTRLKRSGPELDAVVSAGPYTADAARAAGLVDAVSYDDEARAKAKSAAHARVVKRLFEKRDDDAFSLRDLLAALSGDDDHGRIREPHLALVFLSGEIIDSERANVGKAASTPFVAALRRLSDDPNVRAVVLRIESPGGSALASDRMWHAVRRVAKHKPIIVSIGDMAASGGYYVASAGTRIVAAKSSIVGSIGVVGGKVVVAGLASRAGIHVDTLKKSERATWLSPLARFTDGERKVFEAMLSDTYDRFLQRVAEGRGKQIAELVPAAEGRVMGGERAQRLGLVDEVGGFSTALELALREGKLPKDAAVEVFPSEDDPMRALSSLLSGARGASVLEQALEPAAELSHSLAQGAPLSALLRTREPLLLSLPFSLSVHCSTPASFRSPRADC